MASPQADSEVVFTAEGAVRISYRDLLSSPKSIRSSIEQAFGSHKNSLGVIIVEDLPDKYPQLRERLLKFANKFANLDEVIREKYADPSSSYSFGWSHGKEIMNGKPDTLKGSYYSNPVVDSPTVSNEHYKAYPEYYGKNIWPKPDEEELQGFEEAFKDLGSFIFDVGCKLAEACQFFASELLSDKTSSLAELISTSQTTKGRLLHYYPPPTNKQQTTEDEAIDSWCGFHLDHSLLTGLCSAMYILHGGNGLSTVVPPPSSSSGLYIRTRGNDLVKVSIPIDCLAFQTGEALEVATGGRLRATPHCVRVGTGYNAERVSRETFALFMQPNTDQLIGPAETFGQFSKRIFAEHYNSVVSA